MTRFRRAVVALVLTAVASAIVIHPAFASDTFDFGTVKVTILRGPSLTHYQDLATHSDRFASTTRALPAGVEPDASAAYGYSFAGSTFVYLPLRGAVSGSFAYAQFDSMDRLLSTGAFIGQQAQSAIHSMQVADGRTVTDATLTPDGTILNGWHDYGNGYHVPLPTGPSIRPGATIAGLDWSCLNRWLANQGIMGWLIAVVGIACSAACLTVALCPPCIGFMLGLASGTVAQGVKACWR